MIGADDVAWATAGVKLVKVAKDEGWFDKLILTLKGKHNVLLLGPTGVGKTQVRDHLKDSIPQVIHVASRTLPGEPPKTVVVDGTPYEFYDTPGDEGMSDVRHQDATRHVMRPRAGILNVVSYGYHEYDTNQDQVFDGDGSISERYLSSHRRVETSMLLEWIPIIKSANEAPWVITVLNKADLWWHMRQQVRDFYLNGRYGELIKSNGLKHSLVYCAAIRHNFFGRPGTISGHFDDRSMAEVEGKLVKQLLVSSGKKG